MAKLKELKAQLATVENRRLYGYRDNPLGFVDDILHEDPWQVQRDIMSELWDRGRVVVPSCFASGKSRTAARVVLAWVATAPDAIAITTATTWNQVETILWGEIRKAWKPGLPGHLLPRAPEWVISPSNWARGLSVVDPTNLQGYHEGRVLVVVDRRDIH